MGLDITFYEHMTKVNVELDADGEPKEDSGNWACYDEHTDVYIHPDFPTRADGMQGGWHKVEGGSEHLCIGYGSYSQWRDELAIAALGVPAMKVWEDTVTEGPFVELINFSDCEGTLGPRTCAKLAKDFNDWETKIEGRIDEGSRDYFMQKYREFQVGLTLSADGGAACFR